jgi:hypothetical protein
VVENEFKQLRLREVADAIHSINAEVVACRLPCEGIEHDDINLPRSLQFETDGRTGPGVVIVGINPGRIGRSEGDFYQRHGPSAETVEAWFLNMPDRYAYHRRLRDLANLLRFSGPILWTELAKCQSLENAGIPPLQTLRSCSARYLQRELALVPGWPVIGTGWDTYTALGYLCPDRLIIGVPHASGSWSVRHFNALMQGLKATDIKLPSEPVAVWLPGLISNEPTQHDV